MNNIYLSIHLLLVKTTLKILMELNVDILAYSKQTRRNKHI